MNRRVIASLAAAFAAAGVASAHAEGEAAIDCRTTLESHPMDREATTAVFEAMPEACLKELVLGCSHLANGQLMDVGSAALCSSGYEVLLRRTFRGDFNALIAWWQRARREQIRD